MLTKVPSRLLHRLQITAKALLSPTAFGVSGALFDQAGRVLLVRLRYRAGWQFPGGGVGRGEPPQGAVLRELSEEVGLTGGHAEFFALYTRRVWLVSHVVALYRVSGTVNFRPNFEIAEICFAAPDAPPPGTTPATLRRLQELAGAAALSPYW